jgi:preprotein translocase subunit SecA
MRLFGGDQVAKLMSIFKLPEDVPLEHAMVTRALEQAQIKVEGFHFDNRKHLVEYDDVLAKQREIIYRRRRHILEGESQKDAILKKIDAEVGNAVAVYTSEDGTIEREKIIAEFVSIIPFDELSQKQMLTQLQQMHAMADITEFLVKIAADIYAQKEKAVSENVMRQIERWVSLQVIDNLWMDHLDAIDDLREGIGLRGYGQRDPLVEYKNEAFSMFERLVSAIDGDIVHRIFKVQVQAAPGQTQQAATAVLPKETSISQAAKKMRTNAPETSVTKQPVTHNKIGRNDPCWCGSGKKWKKCHYPKTS